VLELATLAHGERISGLQRPMRTMKTIVITIGILLVPLLSRASEEAILVNVSVWVGPEQEIREAFDNVPPTKEPVVGTIDERILIHGAYNSAQLNKLLDVMKRLEGLSPHRSMNEVTTTKEFTIGMPIPSSFAERDHLSLKMQPSADADLVHLQIKFEGVSFAISCQPAEWIVLGVKDSEWRGNLVILKLSKEKLGLRSVAHRSCGGD
jgi:hypothetical protein